MPWSARVNASPKLRGLSMPKPIKVYCYKITDARGEESVDVVMDTCDWISVNGHDAQGQYQQFDSTEAYHVYAWAAEHGFTVEMKEKSFDW